VQIHASRALLFGKVLPVIALQNHIMREYSRENFTLWNAYYLCIAINIMK
jgi:hypothetical protein